MKNKKVYRVFAVAVCTALLWACNVPRNTVKTENNKVPLNYTGQGSDSINSAHLNARAFFGDPYLAALIDSALRNNQELNIAQQEIEIAKNEVTASKGEYLPFVGLKAGLDHTKESGYTASDVIKQNLHPSEKQNVLESNNNLYVAAVASWELDIWRKLRNSNKAATMQYLASREGRNYAQTQVVAEVAASYFELMALDNLLQNVEMNIKLQSDALRSVKLQKESARVSQLAVNRFEAQLLNTQNLQYSIKQSITETENRLYFLTGKFPGSIQRNSGNFMLYKVDSLRSGLPSQLLQNRPDIRQSEFELAAANLNVQVARANFYPSIGIKAGIGFEAFNPRYLINPESLIYNLAGDLMAPLINRNAITAHYNTASAKQIQAVYAYEQRILDAYTDVLNQLARIDNYSRSYEAKGKEVDILVHSITIANNLFNSARADYVEVLLTQEEALKSKMELIEIKLKQLQAKVGLYRALGGGWK